jgi:hypothetical protein
MASSSGFGSTDYTLNRAIHTRFRFAFAYWLKLGTVSKSQDHASRGTPLSWHKAIGL